MGDKHQQMIALDLNSFQQGCGNSNITGAIHVDLESGAFPAEGWSDFPVIILSWWAEALLQLQAPARRAVRWQFMDGPHSLMLTKVTDTVPMGAMTLEEIGTGVIETARRAVAHCDRQKMMCKDLEVLRENLQRLKAHRTTLRAGASGSASIEIRSALTTGSSC